MPTAIEIAQFREAPRSLGMLQQVLTDVPLFNAFDMRTTPGTRFSSMALTYLPSSEFTTLGAGFIMSKGGYELREFGCAYIGALVEVPVDVANRFAAENVALGFDYFTLQAGLRLKADLLHIERQIIYGTARDAKGFPGLKELTPGTIAANVMSMTETADDTDFAKSVINAGGTTDNTLSSAYSVRMGILDCQLVMGGDSGTGEMFQFTERVQQFDAPDPTNAPERKTLMERGQYSGHIGLSVAGFSPVKAGDPVPSQYCLRRMKGLSNDADCGMDDYKAEKLVLSHPDGSAPNLLVMSHRSGDQWAKARRSTGGTVFIGGQGSGRDGTINRAPARPTEYSGIPVIYTRAIKNNETVEVAA